MAPWDARVRWRVLSLRMVSSYAGRHEVARHHARSPLDKSVLIGVKATRVGRMRDRAPACRAGRESPILGWVCTRDCSALLDSLAVRPCFCSGGLPVREIGRA